MGKHLSMCVLQEVPCVGAKVGIFVMLSHATQVPATYYGKTSNSVMPEVEKHWGVPVVIGGDNLPSPSWNRVN